MALLNVLSQPTQRVLATQTLRAIDFALERDGGARYRGLLRKFMPQAEDAYNDKQESGFRRHLGASMIGRECLRELWYNFRWFAKRTFDKDEPDEDDRRASAARFIRLLNRGHLEEPRFLALLSMIGCRLWTHHEDGSQYRIELFGGHFGGANDAIILGIPEAPDVPVLGEFKTHKDSSFTKLVNQGVRESKFVHYEQMQTLMGAWGLRGGIYLAVNKDTDELYGELITPIPELFTYAEGRARDVIFRREPPPRISKDPGWYKCKMCDFHALCQMKTLQPEKNCRTCRFSVAAEDGTWRCTNPQEKRELPLDKQDQLAGCDRHTMLETL